MKLRRESPTVFEKSRANKNRAVLAHCRDSRATAADFRSDVSTISTDSRATQSCQLELKSQPVRLGRICFSHEGPKGQFGLGKGFRAGNRAVRRAGTSE